MQEEIESTKLENRELRAEIEKFKILVNELIANQTGQGNK